MAQVTVKINGYTYTVGCEDGQEDHLTAMSAQVESRVESIKALGSQSGEARLLVLASLLMADEIHDLRVEVEAMRANPPVAPSTMGSQAEKADPELSRKLGRLAIRAEQIAADLEQP